MISFKEALCNERGDGFLVMMTTLNMLLLAFFIVLNSIAVIDDERQRKALGSLLGTLGILSRGLNPASESGKAMLPPSSELGGEEANILDLLENLERFSMQEDLGKKISLQKWRSGVKVYMTNDIVYYKGRDDLTPTAKKLLDKISILVAEFEGDVNVIGHSSPGSSSNGIFPDDWTLSLARAGSAVRYILQNEKIKPERVSVSGYAYTRPYLMGSVPLPEIFNDRLEVTITRKMEY